MIEIQDCPIAHYFIDPLKTVSEANSSEHWTKKARRHKIQKGRVRIAMRSQPCGLSQFTERRDENSKSAQCRIRIIVTRIAPRALDSQDNLPTSLKYICDAIAEEITGDFRPGRADGVDWINWEYRQAKGKPKQQAVIIEIYKIL